MVLCYYIPIFCQSKVLELDGKAHRSKQYALLKESAILINKHSIAPFPLLDLFPVGNEINTSSPEAEKGN